MVNTTKKEFKLVYKVLKDIPGYKKWEIINFWTGEWMQKEVNWLLIVWKYWIDEMENQYKEFFKKVN